MKDRSGGLATKRVPFRVLRLRTEHFLEMRGILTTISNRRSLIQQHYMGDTYFLRITGSRGKRAHLRKKCMTKTYSNHDSDFIATQSANSAVPRNFPRRIGCGCSKTEAALRLIFVNMPPLGYPPRPQPRKSERYLSCRIEEIRLQSLR